MASAIPIPDELAGFIESGLPMTVATRDGELEPDGAWAWAVRVHDDRRGMTVFLHEQAAAAMLRNLADHPEIAIVLDRPIDHRACQVKGVFTASRPATEDERPLVERQIAGLRGALQAIGIPPAMSEAWSWWPCRALELRVTQLYEQTPGPGAGEPLA